ncbi:hypothetical protein KY321_04005 [Candidatus Woesearchaeota archaeon]|nr:hypothetical protein [Candidatus Woesearchaeota archaeon]
MSYRDYINGKNKATQELRTRYKPTKACETARKNKEELAIVVADLSKKALGSDYWSGYYQIYKKRKQDVDAYYNFGDCENYFNRKKLKEVGKVVEAESEKYEEIVSAQTTKQNKIVLFVGTAIMLVGLVIILKKK